MSTITTIEGILITFKEAIKSILREKVEVAGKENEQNIESLQKTLKDLKKVKRLEFPCTFIVDDPLGNCFVEPYDGEEKGRLLKNEYVRTAKQNLKHGIRDEEKGKK